MTAEKDYKKLDLEKVRKRVSKTVSTEEALKDITPINWSKDVLEGKVKVIISKQTGEENV